MQQVSLRRVDFSGSADLAASQVMEAVTRRPSAHAVTEVRPFLGAVYGHCRSSVGTADPESRTEVGCPTQGSAS